MILAGTGHRPNKLIGGYSEEAHQFLVYFIETLLITLPITSVLSGMALGFDQALAQAAINRGIPLTAVVPFKGMWTRWPPPSVSRFNSIMDKADKVVVISETNTVAAFQLRNQYMVDHCDTLVALWDGTPGGTANCVRYAQAVHCNMMQLWEDYVREADLKHMEQPEGLYK